MNDKPVALQLREIRLGARVKLREMARRLGVSVNSYSHYENPERFKDPYLPMHMAERFATALEPDGVSRDSVLALAGAGQSVSGDEFEARLARLSPEGRQKVLQYLSDQELLHAQGKQSVSTGTREEEP